MAEEESRGVVYYAGSLYSEKGHKNKDFFSEYDKSSRSLKENNPSLNVSLMADTEPPEGLIYDDFEKIDKKRDGFIEKITACRKSPYDRTLCLDNDTYITGDITGIFDLLDQFDVVVTHAAMRDFPPEKDEMDWEQKFPDIFPKIQGGFIAFRDTPKVQEFLKRWEEKYEPWTNSPINDQHILANELYTSDLRFFVLPPEYNCRYYFGGFASRQIKIFHGREGLLRHPSGFGYYDYEELDDLLNSDKGPRVFYPSFGRLKMQKKWNLLNMLAFSIRDRGVIGTLKKAWDKLKGVFKS